MPRFYADVSLATETSISLPEQTARHVQVLRLQPGDALTLFNGQVPAGHTAAEGEFEAVVERMGRSDVQVRVGAFVLTAREALRAVHLVVGMPANERMDWLVEKATELGVASIQPLVSERSVLRLKGERAEKKVAHWRGVAIAACEQCGRNRPPQVHEVMSLTEWTTMQAAAPSTSSTGQRLLLSLSESTQPLASHLALAAPTAELTFMSGPEGGLSPGEEASALRLGFKAVTLGPRVLRAETAPLACLALLSLLPALER